MAIQITRRDFMNGVAVGIGDCEPAVRSLPLAIPEQDKLIEYLGGNRNYLTTCH